MHKCNKIPFRKGKKINWESTENVCHVTRQKPICYFYYLQKQKLKLLAKERN